MIKHLPPLTPRPDDINEARKIREENQNTLEQLHKQANYVHRIGDALEFIAESRKHDGFGDSLQSTFTRRGKNK